jgi:hypothetical protein
MKRIRVQRTSNEPREISYHGLYRAIFILIGLGILAVAAIAMWDRIAGTASVPQ